jgi:hypothetical protein
MMILTQPHSDLAVNSTKGSGPSSLPSPLGLFRLHVWNFSVFNPDATSIAYLQLFDAAPATVTVGTTVPTRVIPLPPKGGIDTAHEAPICFTAGVVTYAATTTPTGSSAVATNCILSFDYNY